MSGGVDKHAGLNFNPDEPTLIIEEENPLRIRLETGTGTETETEANTPIPNTDYSSPESAPPSESVHHVDNRVARGKLEGAELETLGIDIS